MMTMPTTKGLWRLMPSKVEMNIRRTVVGRVNVEMSSRKREAIKGKDEGRWTVRRRRTMFTIVELIQRRRCLIKPVRVEGASVRAMAFSM